MRRTDIMKRALFVLIAILGYAVNSPAAAAADFKVVANPSVKASQISVDDLKGVFLATKTSLEGTDVEPVLARTAPRTRRSSRISARPSRRCRRTTEASSSPARARCPKSVRRTRRSSSTCRRPRAPSATCRRRPAHRAPRRWTSSEAWMDRLNITTKIWLCGLIFVVGFLFTTALDQFRALSTEDALEATSSALFPAAQQSQTAASAFQQAVKAFSDAVLVQDTARLDAAAERGRVVAASLRTIGATAGVPEARAREASVLSGEVERFFADALVTYKQAVADTTAMSAEMQTQMRRLAGRTDA